MTSFAAIVVDTSASSITVVSQVTWPNVREVHGYMFQVDSRVVWARGSVTPVYSYTVGTTPEATFRVVLD